MSLNGENNDEYFTDFDTVVDPPKESKHEMYEVVAKAGAENYSDPSLSYPTILESYNLPSGANCSDPKVLSNEITAPTDPMSDFLFSLVKIELVLDKKRESVDELKKMNDLVEFQEASEPFQITPEFQHRYATLILRLDELNQQLKHHIGVVIHHITEPPPELSYGEGYISQPPDQGIYVPTSTTQWPIYEYQEYMNSANPYDVVYIKNSFVKLDIAAKYGMNDISVITNLRRRCEDEAFEIVNKLKASQGPSKIDESKFTLIAKLTSILTLLSHLQENRINGNELACIEEVFADIRQHLHPCNLKSFEQSVEQLVSHIVYQLSPSILPMSSNVVPPSNSSASNPNVSDAPYSN